jgi:predicted ATP-dependent endonuclease of OLD family
MKIISVRIRNFRSFVDVTVPLNDYTCLVGPNGSGKSTILCALNIFFRETENATTDLCHLDREDFHQKNTAAPVEIIMTFGDLSAAAQKTSPTTTARESSSSRLWPSSMKPPARVK